MKDSKIMDTSENHMPMFIGEEKSCKCWKQTIAESISKVATTTKSNGYSYASEDIDIEDKLRLIEELSKLLK